MRAVILGLSLLLVVGLSMAAPRPKAKDPTPWIVVTCPDNEIHLSKDFGKTFDTLKLEKDAPNVMRAIVSPDHTKLILLTREKASDKNISVAMAKLGEPDQPIKIKTVAEFQHILHLLPLEKSNNVYVSGLDTTKLNQPNILRHTCWESSVINLETGEKKDLPVCGEYRIWATIPGSEEVLAIRTANLKARGKGIRGPEISLVQTSVGNLKPQVIIPEELDLVPMLLLRDGNTILVTTQKAEVGVFDTSKNELKLWKDPDSSSHRLFQFDHISNKVLCVRFNAKSTNSELIQLDSDGTNRTEIKTFDKQIRWLDVR